MSFTQSSIILNNSDYQSTAMTYYYAPNSTSSISFSSTIVKTITMLTNSCNLGGGGQGGTKDGLRTGAIGGSGIFISQASFVKIINYGILAGGGGGGGLSFLASQFTSVIVGGNGGAGGGGGGGTGSQSGCGGGGPNNGSFNGISASSGFLAGGGGGFFCYNGGKGQGSPTGGIATPYTSNNNFYMNIISGGKGGNSTDSGASGIGGSGIYGGGGGGGGSTIFGGSGGGGAGGGIGGSDLSLEPSGNGGGGGGSGGGLGGSSRGGGYGGGSGGYSIFNSGTITELYNKQGSSSYLNIGGTDYCFGPLFYGGTSTAVLTKYYITITSSSVYGQIYNTGYSAVANMKVDFDIDPSSDITTDETYYNVLNGITPKQFNNTITLTNKLKITWALVTGSTSGTYNLTVTLLTQLPVGFLSTKYNPTTDLSSIFKKLNGTAANPTGFISNNGNFTNKDLSEIYQPLSSSTKASETGFKTTKNGYGGKDLSDIFEPL